MTYAPQSSPALHLLPACIVACLLVTSRVAAQDDQRLALPAELHREPDGAALVSLPEGAPISTGRKKGAWHEAAVEGWIYSKSLASTKREGFDLVVISKGGENLRRTPNGTVIGHAREGTLLQRVAVRGRWTRVRRAGWVPRTAVASTPKAVRTEAQRSAQRPDPASQASSPPARSEAAAGAPRSAGGPDAAAAGQETALLSTPGGAEVALLRAGAPARVVGRSGEWARVEVAGWVKGEDLRPDEGGALVGVTAAEVRAAPDRYVGRVVEWRLQVIAVQIADQLRSELPPGQPYLLTRGPLPEPGFVYVGIPAERAAEFKALPPLQEVTLRVSIKAARTKYLPTPVAEFVSVAGGMGESAGGR